jgi:hypothetical protein
MSKFLGLVCGLLLVVLSAVGIARWWYYAVGPFLLAGVTLTVLLVGLLVLAWAISSIMEGARTKPEPQPEQPKSSQPEPS